MNPIRIRTIALLMLLGSLSLTGCSGPAHSFNPVTHHPHPNSNPGSRRYPMKLPDVVVHLPTKDAIQACYFSASSLEKQGDYQGAVRQLNQIRAMEPSNPEVLHRLAVLYDKQGQFQAAEPLYRELAVAKVNDPNIFNDWGYSYYLQKSYDQAARYFTRALAVDRDNVRARCNLAMTLGQMGRHKEAREQFVAAGLRGAELYCNLAYMYWNQGNVDEAKEQLVNARHIDPSHSKALQLLVHIEGQTTDVSPQRLVDAETNRPINRGKAVLRQSSVGHTVSPSQTPLRLSSRELVVEDGSEENPPKPKTISPTSQFPSPSMRISPRDILLGEKRIEHVPSSALTRPRTPASLASQSLPPLPDLPKLLPSNRPN